MTPVLTENRAFATLFLIAGVFLALSTLLAGGAEGSAQITAAPVVPDRDALDIDDPAESAAADVYFAAGDDGPTTVSFNGAITLGALELEGEFSLTRVDDGAFEHQVTIENLTVSERSPLTGGIVVDSIESGTFQWGDSGFAGTATGLSAVAFAGDRNDPGTSADDLGIEVTSSSFFLRLEKDTTYVYDFVGSGILMGAIDLSLEGTFGGQANTTGQPFSETVTIGGESRLIDVPAVSGSVRVVDGALDSPLGQLTGNFEFRSGSPSSDGEIGLLATGTNVEARLGESGPQLVVRNAYFAGVVLADGTHGFHGSGDAAFDNIDAGRGPTINGQVGFAENTSGVALLHSFILGGTDVTIELPPNVSAFSGEALSLDILDASILGDLQFTEEAEGDIAIDVRDGALALGDGTSDLLRIEELTGTYTVATDGVIGSTTGHAVVIPADLDIVGTLTLEIDTTAVRPFARVLGVALSLEVDDQSITGEFTIEEIATGSGRHLVLLGVTSGAFSLGDGSNEFVLANGIAGGMLLSAEGLAGDLAANTVFSDGVPAPFAAGAGTGTLSINTTSAPIRESFVVGGSPLRLDVPAGPFLGFYFASTSFSFGPIIVNGDFFLDQIQLGDTLAVRWSVTNASLDTGALDMTDGEGAFLTSVDGTAGSIFGDSTDEERPLVGFRFNNTGRAVEETIEFDGPYEIHFSAAEGDIAAVFAVDSVPLISVTSPLAGGSVELNSRVIVSFTCQQNGPFPIESCRATVGDDDVENGDTIDTSTPGPIIVTFRAEDSADVVVRKTVTFTVRPDTGVPTIVVAAPAPRSEVFAGTSLRANYSCADTGGSGLARCVGSVNGVPIANGAAIDTETVGVFTFAVLATDGAGNQVQTSYSFTVKQVRPGDDQVARLYQAALGRKADAPGLTFWTARYRSGSTLTAIAADLLTSAEARARYGPDLTDEAFVRALYTNALGRPADATGLAFWTGRLATLTRADLVVRFSESPENIARTGTTPPLTSASSKIVRLYQAAFGRRPDASGQAFWESVFPSQLTLEGVAALFLSSPEAMRLYGENPSNGDFVDALYQNVLGRPGDESGRAFWLGRLRTGSSRTSVLVSFSESVENLQRTGTRP